MTNHLPWILVANGTKARIFRFVKPEKIEEVTALIHHEGKLHNQDLVSSNSGQGPASGFSPVSTYDPARSPRQLESEKFAREVVHYLETEHKNGTLTKFYLFASAPFIGLLRKTLNEKLHHIIIKEINKDITDHTILQIEKEVLDL